MDNTISFFNITSKIPDLTINQIVSLGRFMHVGSKYLYYFLGN